MRLIDADALREKRLPKEKTSQFVVQVIMLKDLDSAPTVDVVPVVHGRWDKVPNRYMSVASKNGSYSGNATSCSVCLELNPNAYKTNYCPNCGAKMDLEVDGEEQSQKTPLKTLRCVYAESAKENEIGEELVWCEWTGRWMNVSLGECYGQCESQAAEVDA